MVGEARVHPIVFLSRAADAPTDDADLKRTALAIVGHKRPAAIALAGVFATFLKTGTNLLGIDLIVGIALGAGFGRHGGDRRLQQALGAGGVLLSVGQAVRLHGRAKLQGSEASDTNLRTRGCRWISLRTKRQ